MTKIAVQPAVATVAQPLVSFELPDPVATGGDDRLPADYNRLQRALRALYTRKITWLPKRKFRQGYCRAGLFELESVKPLLLLVYSNGISEPMLRVNAAREWSEGILTSPLKSDSDKLLQNVAKEVLRFLGERKL